MLFKKIYLYIRNIFCNIITIFFNLFIKRDKKIWLFGAWMGDTFSDNPRFLFQFLHCNKNQYGIKSCISYSAYYGIFCVSYAFFEKLLLSFESRGSFNM